MAEKDMVDLLDRLLGVADKLDWTYDPNYDGYWVRAEPHVVEIRSMDRDGHHPYGLLILSGPDEVVESLISGEDLPQELLFKLEKLYFQAKRAEKNLPGVIEDILQKLPEP